MCCLIAALEFRKWKAFTCSANSNFTRESCDLPHSDDKVFDGFLTDRVITFTCYACE